MKVCTEQDPAMEVERSSWTIELVSFQFRPIRRESGLLQRTIQYRTAVTNLCCSAGQLVAGLMGHRGGGGGWGSGPNFGIYVGPAYPSYGYYAYPPAYGYYGYPPYGYYGGYPY